MSDLIDRQELLKHKGNCYDEEGCLLYAVGTGTILLMPTVDAVEVVRCKDCKYFYYNKAYNIQGFPIMGNSVCDKWANGCRTDENGYCFLGERKEDA